MLKVKERGGTDMAAMVAAINILPKTQKGLTKRPKGSKMKHNNKEGIKHGL